MTSRYDSDPQRTRHASEIKSIKATEYKSGTERDVAARKVSGLLIAAVGELGKPRLLLGRYGDGRVQETFIPWDIGVERPGWEAMG